MAPAAGELRLWKLLPLGVTERQRLEILDPETPSCCKSRHFNDLHTPQKADPYRDQKRNKKIYKNYRKRITSLSCSLRIA